MRTYTVEVQYLHTQDEIDWIETHAESEREAVEQTRRNYLRSRYLELRDAVILSVTAHLVPQRRYSLRLGSDAEDLEVEVVQ
jgi:hypothetical protein